MTVQAVHLFEYSLTLATQEKEKKDRNDLFLKGYTIMYSATVTRPQSGVCVNYCQSHVVNVLMDGAIL